MAWRRPRLARSGPRERLRRVGAIGSRSQGRRTGTRYRPVRPLRCPLSALSFGATTRKPRGLRRERSCRTSVQAPGARQAGGRGHGRDDGSERRCCGAGSQGDRRDPRYGVSALPAALADAAGDRRGGRDPTHGPAVRAGTLGAPPRQGHQGPGGLDLVLGVDDRLAAGRAHRAVAVPGAHGAITRAIAAEVAGQDSDVEQSYRFGFTRLWPRC